MRESLLSQGFTGTACYVCSWANYLHGLQKLKLGSRSDSDFKTAFSFLHLLSQWTRPYPVVWSLAQPSTEKWMNKLFRSNDFRVEHNCEVAGSLGNEVAPGEYKNIYYLLQTNCNFQMIMCGNLFMILNIKHLLLDFMVLFRGE
jgi:hypothetical protein